MKIWGLMIMNDFAFMEKFYMAVMGGAKGLGHKGIAQLVKIFGSAKSAWHAETGDLLNSGVRKNSIEAFIAFRAEHPDAPEELRSYCERHEINLCCISDDDYPPLLKEIDSPPMFFYYRGKLQPHAQRIGIVGSRRCSLTGQEVALEFGELVAAAGFTVVSGAAMGIDTFAHCGALKSGRTVAVLGCGINCVGSPVRENFLAQIAENGVVISELNPLVTPTSGTLIARNRIIAGLCQGLVVVEAEIKSGTMSTANYARNYGRKVFAVSKNNYKDNGLGINQLICRGAVPIKSSFDIINRLKL